MRKHRPLAKIWLTLLCLLIPTAFLPITGRAQGLLDGPSPLGGAETPVSGNAYLERGTVVPGGGLRLAIVLDVKPEWHIYGEELGPADAIGNPTTVELAAPDLRFSKVRFPPPKKLPQPGIGEGGRDTWIWSHEGKVVLHSVGKVAEGATPGERTLSIRVDGLACKESCLPFSVPIRLNFQIGAKEAEPTRPELFKDFPADLVVDSVAAAATKGGEDSGTRAATDTRPVPTFDRYQVRRAEESRSFLTYLLLGLLAGIILNFMPCVLPVISIKILSFVQQSGEDRSRIFRLGLVFSAGIIAVFIVLAALAAFAQQGWGEQFQSQAFLITMIAIVFAFALSLFGVYELGLPGSVAALGGRERREGYGDAFAKGVMATLLATPCSGPFLGSTLTWALTQEKAVIFAVFLSIGVGMALPYTILTAKPTWLKILPRPGAWMLTFKHIMGFVLLLTVLYLMVSLRQDLLLFTIAFLVFVALGAWIHGRFALEASTPWARWTVLGAAVLAIGLGAWLSFGALPRLFEESHGDGIAWAPFDPEVLEELHSSGTTVMVDWTADWCPNCKFVERFVLESKEIRTLLDELGVVALKADITRSGDATQVMQALQKVLGSRSIPFLAVFPGGDPYHPYVLRDIYTIGDLREILLEVRDTPAR